MKLRRYRVFKDEFVGYGYRIPDETVCYRFTRGCARRTVALLNNSLTRPIYFYEKVS